MRYAKTFASMHSEYISNPQIVQNLDAIDFILPFDVFISYSLLIFGWLSIAKKGKWSCVNKHLFAVWMEAKRHGW